MVTLKRISPWIAYLVIVLNLLAMPMSRAMQAPDLRMMLWGGFCSGGNLSALPKNLGKVMDALQLPHSKSVMQHDACCCGHAGLVALPSNYYRHFLPQYTANTTFENPVLPTLHPRIRWPSLSPRASPFA